MGRPPSQRGKLLTRRRESGSLPGVLLCAAALVLAIVAPLTLPSSPPRPSVATWTHDAPPAPDPPIDTVLKSGQLFLSASLADQPRLRRWEPLAWQAVGVDPNAFAMLMAFIVTESGGYRFAVSRTGCVGLMQFCSRTALRCPFDRIFDIDRLHRCRCLGRRCRVPWRTRLFLETHPRELHPIVASDFPCSLTDPRFDPQQAIRAGWAYIDQLSSAFEGNIYLAYIGYNSGPDVAEAIWLKLGARKARSLRNIGRFLPWALRPKFRRRARRRARSLLRIHLPKIARIYRLYQEAAAARMFPGDGPKFSSY